MQLIDRRELDLRSRWAKIDRQGLGAAEARDSERTDIVFFGDPTARPSGRDRPNPFVMVTTSEYPPSAGPPRDVTEASVTPEPRGPAAWRANVRSALRKLGPGLVTGASDDDPSGIATYSQVGAQFGYAMLWTMLVSTP